MYSPKIDEKLIPRLYRLGKLKRIPMTRLLNGILERALPELENIEGGKGDPLPNSKDHEMNRSYPDARDLPLNAHHRPSQAQS